MLNKLAYRNVKRSARDYLVYFLTMALVTALMFSFNTLLFSKDIQDMFDLFGAMAAMIGLATFFIVLIIAWLIHYMMRFILEKRSREFGIYLLIGMKKKEIAALYIRENLLLGAGAFVAGMGLSVLLGQVLMLIFYSMIQMDYRIHLEWNQPCFFMTAACYGGCYLLALIRCKRKFRKMEIHDLMDSHKKNEEIRGKYEKAIRLLFPFAILLFVVFGALLFCYKAWDMGLLCLFLVGLTLAVYCFYIGISAWISCYVQKKGTAIYYGDCLFLFRQFSSKIKTMSLTMGTLSALFTLALLGCAVALMFNHFQNQILTEKFPFDVQVYSSDVNDDFEQEIDLLKKETQVDGTYIYRIYENGTNQVNTWLYTHLKVFGGEYLKADGTPDQEKILRNEEMVYCDYDTYMGISDYNNLRRMLGLKGIPLKKTEYLLHMKARVLNETGDFSKKISIDGTDGPLAFAGYYTESFSQDGHNGGDYIIVVPDSVIRGMRPYYAEFVADLAKDAPGDLQDRLDGLETDERRIDSLGHVMTEAESDDWEEEELGNSCSGSDTVVVYVSKNLVRDNLVPEIKYMLSCVIFPLFYVGLVFFCVALTVLSVQQLSDSAKYRFRYRVLSQIGYSRKRISLIILKQLAGYYMCPALVALAISGMVSIYTGSKFNFYTGTHTAAIAYFLISTALFFGIYMMYFMAAYIGFKRNVEKQ